MPLLRINPIRNPQSEAHQGLLDLKLTQGTPAKSTTKVRSIKSDPVVNQSKCRQKKKKKQMTENTVLHLQIVDWKESSGTLVWLSPER